MASTADITIGSYIRYNNDICQIMEWQHRTPGNLRAFYQGTRCDPHHRRNPLSTWQRGPFVDRGNVPGLQ